MLQDLYTAGAQYHMIDKFSFLWRQDSVIYKVLKTPGTTQSRSAKM